jgi:Aspartyl protease
MSFPFDPHQGLILVEAELEGSAGIVAVQLALDTAATDTLIGAIPMGHAGYVPSPQQAQVQMATTSGTTQVPVLRVTRFRALGQDRGYFPILCHTLPPGAVVDGVLGLDFVRRQTLKIDFRMGQISLT